VVRCAGCRPNRKDNIVKYFYKYAMYLKCIYFRRMIARGMEVNARRTSDLGWKIEEVHSRRGIILCRKTDGGVVTLGVYIAVRMARTSRGKLSENREGFYWENIRFATLTAVRLFALAFNII